MKRIINSLLLVTLLVSCSTNQADKEQKDFTLVIPGRAAEGFSLNDKAASTEGAAGIEGQSIPPSLSGLIKDNHIPVFRFNRIIYSRNRYALFLNDGVVNAIAGLSPVNRVTDEAVNLQEGADNFIINYGNNGLKIISEGSHRVYIYRGLGIAIFDDYGDDSIDMYLVFTPVKD